MREDLRSWPRLRHLRPEPSWQSFSSAGRRGSQGDRLRHASSKLSATYQAAVLGAETIADRVEVRVVDSLASNDGPGPRCPRRRRCGRSWRRPGRGSGRGRVQPGPDGALRGACLPRQPAQGRPPRVGSSPAGRPARHKAGSRGPRRRFGARVTSANAFSLLGARSCQGT